MRDKNYISEELINEFRLTPVKSLELYGVFDGSKIYSSESLIKNVLKILNKNSEMKPFMNKIEELIERNKLIIGYSSKSVARFVLRRFFNRDPKDFILGAYVQEDDKIYILLDHAVTLSGKQIINLSEIIIHELTHMAANKHRSQFISGLSKEFISYFNYYFDDFSQYFFGRNLGKLDSNSLLKTLDNINEANFTEKTDKMVLNVAIKNWLEFIKTQFGIKEFEGEMAQHFIEFMIYPYVINILGVKRVKTRKNTERIEFGIMALQDSYTSLGFRTLNVTVGQEIVTPSEIICVYSEKYIPRTLINLIERI